MRRVRSWAEKSLEIDLMIDNDLLLLQGPNSILHLKDK